MALLLKVAEDPEVSWESYAQGIIVGLGARKPQHPRRTQTGEEVLARGTGRSVGLQRRLPRH